MEHRAGYQLDKGFEQESSGQKNSGNKRCRTNIEVSLLRVYTGGDHQAEVTDLQSFLPTGTAADCSNTWLLCRVVFLVCQPGLLTGAARQN